MKKSNKLLSFLESIEDRVYFFLAERYRKREKQRIISKARELWQSGEFETKEKAIIQARLFERI